jgi:hypothetical protein
VSGVFDLFSEQIEDKSDKKFIEAVRDESAKVKEKMRSSSMSGHHSNQDSVMSSELWIANEPSSLEPAPWLSIHKNNQENVDVTKSVFNIKAGSLKVEYDSDNDEITDTQSALSEPNDFLSEIEDYFGNETDIEDCDAIRLGESAADFRHRRKTFPGPDDLDFFGKKKGLKNEDLPQLKPPQNENIQYLTPKEVKAMQSARRKQLLEKKADKNEDILIDCSKKSKQQEEPLLVRILRNSSSSKDPNELQAIVTEPPKDISALSGANELRKSAILTHRRMKSAPIYMKDDLNKSEQPIENHKQHRRCRSLEKNLNLNLCEYAEKICSDDKLKMDGNTSSIMNEKDVINKSSEQTKKTLGQRLTLTSSDDIEKAETKKGERSDKMKKIISQFLPSVTFQAIPRPFASHEHFITQSQPGLFIIINEKEPTSLIAFCLSSTEYKNELEKIQNTLMGPFNDSVSPG